MPRKNEEPRRRHSEACDGTSARSSPLGLSSKSSRAHHCHSGTSALSCLGWMRRVPCRRSEMWRTPASPLSRSIRAWRLSISRAISGISLRRLFIRSRCCCLAASIWASSSVWSAPPPSAVAAASLVVSTLNWTLARPPALRLAPGSGAGSGKSVMPVGGAGGRSVAGAAASVAAAADAASCAALGTSSAPAARALSAAAGALASGSAAEGAALATGSLDSIFQQLAAEGLKHEANSYAILLSLPSRQRRAAQAACARSRSRGPGCWPTPTMRLATTNQMLRADVLGSWLGSEMWKVALGCIWLSCVWQTRKNAYPSRQLKTSSSGRENAVGALSRSFVSRTPHTGQMGGASGWRGVPPPPTLFGPLLLT